MKLSDLKLNIDNAEHGMWFEYYGGIEFKIARLGNTTYQLRYATLLNEANEEYGNHVPAKVFEVMMTKALATCVTDWKGIDTDDNETLEYSLTAVEEMLLNPEYSDVRDFIAMKSNLRENYRQKNDKKIKKS